MPSIYRSIIIRSLQYIKPERFCQRFVALCVRDHKNAFFVKIEKSADENAKYRGYIAICEQKLRDFCKIYGTFIVKNGKTEAFDVDLCGNKAYN